MMVFATDRWADIHCLGKPPTNLIHQGIPLLMVRILATCMRIRG